MTLDDLAPPHWRQLAGMSLLDASIIVRQMTKIYKQSSDEYQGDRYAARFVALHNARRYLVSLNT